MAISKVSHVWLDEVNKGNIWRHKYEHIVDVEAFTRYLTAYTWHVFAKARE